MLVFLWFWHTIYFDFLPPFTILCITVRYRSRNPSGLWLGKACALLWWISLWSLISSVDKNASYFGVNEVSLGLICLFCHLALYHDEFELTFCFVQHLCDLEWSSWDSVGPFTRASRSPFCSLLLCWSRAPCLCLVRTHFSVYKKLPEIRKLWSHSWYSVTGEEGSSDSLWFVSRQEITFE